MSACLEGDGSPHCNAGALRFDQGEQTRGAGLLTLRPSWCPPWATGFHTRFHLAFSFPRSLHSAFTQSFTHDQRQPPSPVPSPSPSPVLLLNPHDHADHDRLPASQMALPRTPSIPVQLRFPTPPGRFGRRRLQCLGTILTTVAEKKLLRPHVRGSDRAFSPAEPCWTAPR